MDSIFKDLRFAVRSLGENPGFSLVVVLILALGIGANSAIFTLVDSVLLRPLRYADSDRLLLLWETHPSLDGMSVAYLNFRDWQQQNGVFEHLAAYRYQEYNLTGREQPEVIQAAQVSASLFPRWGSNRIEAGSSPMRKTGPGPRRRWCSPTGSGNAGLAAIPRSSIRRSPSTARPSP